jgi:colanic acid/amylovoran biosynthesis protein
LSDPRLRKRAADILPSVSLIAVRESTFSPGILKGLGVSEESIVTTGDDALATLGSAADNAADAIGVNVRVVDYAGTTSQDVEALSSVFGSLSATLGARLVPVPISTHPHEDDSARLEELGISGPVPGDPAGAIELARRCRVMVTGSYHAAVFALGQGIPAVCLAASPYYRLKFGGLRGMFGRWCEVVDSSAADASDRVRTLVERAYHAWPAPRRELVAAATLQVAAGGAAYKRLAALEFGRAPR